MALIPQGYERGLVPALMLPLGARLLARVPVAPGALVLDAAAGTGALARQLPHARVVAADSWDEMVAFGRGLVPAARWTLADVERLPFRDGAFDAALCQHGLPFAEDPARAVAELARVTRPGGTVAALLWTGLAESLGFAALGAAVERRLGRSLALRFDDALETAAGLRALFAVAGLDARVEHLAHDARFPSPTAFVRAYVAGSWLADALTPEDERAIVDEVEATLRGAGAFRVEAHVVVAQRAR